MGFSGGAEHYIHDYGYAAVSVGLLLEHFGLPLPGETMLIGAAVLASRGTFDIAPLLVVAWASATLGNMLGYAIGRYGGHLLIVRYGARVGITREKLDEVEAFFARYGDIVIVGARFVVLLRQLSGIAAGTLEMRWRRFLVFNALGAALWVGWWGLLAYGFGQSILNFAERAGHIEPVLSALAALAILFVIAWLYRRKRR
jgi:membrane protein DedA with SNARE-associated domain